MEDTRESERETSGVSGTKSRATHLTHAGTWLAYFLNHPAELPEKAPEPHEHPAEFAEWADHNMPRFIKMKVAKK